ncbi:MAG: ATP-binding protein [Rickettsiales bacterium]
MTSRVAQEKLLFNDLNPSFIPFACHIDDDTILTKNGNLIQTIKITGFSYELIGAKQVDLRSTIRTAIKKYVKNDNFSLWLHTIRRKKDLSLKLEQQNYFCHNINRAWNTLHDWSDKYVNELYISIITESKSYRAKNLANILKCISFVTLKKTEKKFIAKQKKLLSELTDQFLSDLADFGAQKLALYKIDNQYYSAQLKFFSKILNLEERDFPLEEIDLSNHIADCQIVFGKNMLEVIKDNQKHYATIFSIKDYCELSLKSLDKFLHAPIEFIICQTIDFVNANDAKSGFIEQDKILKISNDTKFAEHIGLSEIISTSTSPTAFGEHQLTLMLIDESKDKLLKSISKTTEIFANFGLVIVREDLFMENCFWSQLPGNFYYICRRKAINTSKFAGFASLANFPAGKFKNNKWGEAISVFYTHHKTPYFFNFHCEENGHTMIIGPEGTGKTVLLNFLLAQANKFKPRIVYLDFFNSSEVFINALGGKYLSLDLENKLNLFNPLPLFKNDAEFIYRFLSYLMIETSEVTDKKYEQVTEKQQLLKQISQQLASEEITSLGDLSAYFKNTKYAKFFDLWVNNNKLAHIFDNQVNLLDNHDIISLDLTRIANVRALLIPITYYIMHYLEKTLDGRPTILVIDEAFKILDNPFLSKDIHNFLERLTKNNAIAILATESLEDAKNSNITNLLTNEIATQILLPNQDSGADYQSIFKLSKQENALVKQISSEQRKFVLKHGTEAIIAELDLANLINIVSILSSSDLAVKIMYKVKQKFGNNPKDWLSPYQELLEDSLKEILENHNSDIAKRDEHSNFLQIAEYNYENDLIN